VADADGLDSVVDCGSASGELDVSPPHAARSTNAATVSPTSARRGVFIRSNVGLTGSRRHGRGFPRSSRSVPIPPGQGQLGSSTCGAGPGTSSSKKSRARNRNVAPTRFDGKVPTRVL
jgi:hypothetical protein